MNDRVGVSTTRSSSFHSIDWLRLVEMIGGPHVVVVTIHEEVGILHTYIRYSTIDRHLALSPSNSYSGDCFPL